jgi:hypothetical protein
VSMGACGARLGGWRRGFVCILLGSLFVTASSEERARAEGPVRASGLWLVPVAFSNASVVPWGDGQHVWVADEHAVWVVNQQGVRTHVPGDWLAAGAWRLELSRTEAAGRAWLIASPPGAAGGSGQARLYLVEAGQDMVHGRAVLEADRILVLREQPFSSPYDVHPNVSLGQDLEPHARLWVVYRQAGKDVLAVVASDGTVTPVSSAFGTVEAAEVLAWRIIPLGKEPGVWLATRTQLFFVDARRPAAVQGPLLRADGEPWVVPVQGGPRAWVMAKVYSPASARSVRQLFLVDAAAPPGARPTLLLKGESVRQVVSGIEGSRAWVALSWAPEHGAEGGVELVGPDGASLLPAGPLFRGQRTLVSVTRSGRVWVLTHTGGAYLLEADGRVLASGERVLDSLIANQEGIFEFTTFAGVDDELWVHGRQVTRLRAKESSVHATPLLDGMEVVWLQVQPDGQSAWAEAGEDDALYFISWDAAKGFESHRVSDYVDIAHVLFSDEAMHGWIQALPASMAYVPHTKVGVSLRLRGGSLVIEPGGRLEVKGRLALRAPLDEDEASLELDWPGREHAARVRGVLEVTLWDEDRPQSPVASATRRFAPGEPPAQLNWYLDDLLSGERSYKIVFEYRDTVGTHAKLEVRGVRFQMALTEEVWFRTAMACLLGTVLFLGPLVILPRTRLSWRRMPFVGWSINILGGSGLALGGLASTWRIHFPALIGVLFAEMLLCLLFGLVSPPAFRLLSATWPFRWLVPLALGMPSTRRRILTDYVAHVGRKVEAWRHQANDERYISLAIAFQEGATSASPRAAPALAYLAPREPEERISRFLSHPEGGNVLIESPGGRGKSALLREVVRRMLSAFMEDPSRPLPVLCDGSHQSLEEAAFHALESNPLPKDIHEMLMSGGGYVLVVDGLTESALEAHSLREFIDGKYGSAVRLLLTSRPHRDFRQVVESSRRWLVAEPRRLDEQTLSRFIAAYAPGRVGGLGKGIDDACRGPDGTYLPILARLALLFENDSGHGIAALYEQAFRALLRRHEVAGGEDEELLAWAGDFCVRTYWANGIRSLRYRNAPEQARMQKLLGAGILVPDGPSAALGQQPGQVRFFHDSMQSYLTACGLFAREQMSDTWDFLRRAAADPLFSHSQSELVSGVGSELFQMCLQVFGPEEKLRRELRRQLMEWADLHDDDLRKRDILSAVPELVQPLLAELLHQGTELSPRRVLQAAIFACSEDLTSLGLLYMHMANLLWPLADEPAGRLELGPPPPDSPPAPVH